MCPRPGPRNPFRPLSILPFLSLKSEALPRCWINRLKQQRLIMSRRIKPWSNGGILRHPAHISALGSQANSERNQAKLERDTSVAEHATIKSDFHQLNLKLVELQRENEQHK
eukprot:5374403-Pyramimonas_sp.AAC.1